MLDDCYFYLYSECKLKERCRFRHNPLSKDNLILCKNWSKNKKCRLDCPLRHSLYHVVKQRSDTMCYWEDKGGCTKYRCEYKHVDPSKDEWKEPKVKLLTEIIESKNIHNNTSTISISDISEPVNDDVTISDAEFAVNKCLEDKTEYNELDKNLKVGEDTKFAIKTFELENVNVLVNDKGTSLPISTVDSDGNQQSETKVEALTFEQTLDSNNNVEQTSANSSESVLKPKSSFGNDIMGEVKRAALEDQTLETEALLLHEQSVQSTTGYTCSEKDKEAEADNFKNDNAVSSKNLTKDNLDVAVQSKCVSNNEKHSGSVEKPIEILSNIAELEEKAPLKRKIVDQSLYKKSKSDSNIDIESLDKEIAEIEELLKEN
ncbi:hypothetical protein NCER_100841 [Vairimorpha ceranae BRL01]|uniref:C3H1-type domain-containing protein n=1 Tax=Vairimorpha ceranae (strain BRL01) TaxID=578460 RepID=C4V8L0_VAIC1|nr:hypothetical protein NCER_100841 [Vairimorpha ceranae BRL01]